MKSRAALLAVLALGVCSAGSAAAADCPSGATCGRLTVPLDHAGRAPGTLGLVYAKLPATGPRSGTLVFLTGGPGQAAVPFTNDFASLIKPLRESYDIVAVDQRGTGESDAVHCSQSSDNFVTDCAAKLGDRRAYFSTPQTARDLEDLRVALGVDKLALYGVSYGTNVAADYVRLYPEHTAAVVLDSPTPVDGLDGVDELRVFGTPRVLAEACYPGLCHATVRDTDAALTAAVKRVQKGSIHGPSVSLSGHPTTVRVGEGNLYSAISASDRLPSLRAGLPAAIASLAAGDAAPLIHLDELNAPSGARGSNVNEARLLATTCIESRLPWAPDSAVSTRIDALKAFVVQRTAVFAPFSPAVVLSNSAAALCAEWPPTPAPESVPYGGPPNVPVLVISGRQDLRTPLESAHRTAAQYPDATLLRVASAGHSVLSTDLSDCAQAGLIAFLSGHAVQQCDKAEQDRFTHASAPYIPASLAQVRPTRLSGVPGRVFSAVGLTLTGIGFDAASRTGNFHLPGLRSGYVVGRRTTLQLHGVEWIKGVKVSGTLGKGGGTLTVSGPAPGTLTYSSRAVTGSLGGVAMK